MIDILTSKNVKARKEYRCLLCGDKIAVGETHRYTSYTYGGTINSYRLHLHCNSAISDYVLETRDSEWTTGGVMELVNDKLRNKGIEPAKTVRDAVKQLYIKGE